LIGGGGANEQGLIGPFARIINTTVQSPFVSQQMGMMMAELNHNDLAILGDLMQSAKVKPVIDRTYKLSDLPEAIRYLEEGHARGKVVITLE
jgi:NADPH:quinone reductase-like Zn-dependent oxidoreductase